MVVGWYHSHPGFGCWLSSVDVNTQQSFEALNDRAVSVVVDPIQSVKGKVILCIDFPGSYRCFQTDQSPKFNDWTRTTPDNL
jgi:proteasome lid subunit RPN8/RPN11